MATSDRADDRGRRRGRYLARRFGENIRLQRVAAGTSQRELARILRLSHSVNWNVGRSKPRYPARALYEAPRAKRAGSPTYHRLTAA